ncbi:MAG: replication-associated recombination protein A [Alicyclobacillaceae bacterium]|jgi:putative ATPase|nr:replication-associated recombination protein A [Alicyclobacillaceae bacterium]
MDLFERASQSKVAEQAPLAYRMRPVTLDDIVGQPDVVGESSALRRAVLAKRLMSVLLYGPPGTGKTSLAHVIARESGAVFVELNAVSAGVADLRQVVREATEQRALYGQKTLVFIDEIHRFNKNQQDALLPHVEAGLLTLIGATTENPYFEVNPALLSRSLLFRLQPLDDASVRLLLGRALADEERGLGSVRAEVTEAALAVFIRHAAGDARRALNALELAVLTAPLGAEGTPVVGEADALASLQTTPVLYDKAGDEHYDTISAFIKAVRGSDVDAALFWLAKMVVAGEDPLFIARRLIILAVEDIGLAEPYALTVAVSGLHALQAIGMPEGRIVLADVTAMLAKAKKSNAAYKALDAAIADVRAGVTVSVPLHLRSTAYAGSAKLGNGIGYLYPHDFPGHRVEQSYWPEGMPPKKYLEEEELDG